MNIQFGLSDFILAEQTILESVDIVGAEHILLGDFSLYTSEGLSVVTSENQSTVIVGDIYSPSNPEWMNEDVLQELEACTSLSELAKELAPCNGRFIVFKKVNEQWYIIGDACCQFEVFFHAQRSICASNVNLIDACTDTDKWEGEAKQVYQRIAKGDELPIGYSTRIKSVKHLLPNHYLNLHSREQLRYFPTVDMPLLNAELNSAVTDISNTLIGSMEAFSKRYKLALPVTAGYDSRLLLAAAKNQDARTFIFQHPNMSADFYDIVIAKKLCEAVDRRIEIIQYDLKVSNDMGFSEPPRKSRLPVLLNGMRVHFSKDLLLSGNIGEIGRTYYADLKGVNANMLAKLMGFGASEFVQSEMQKWLDSVELDQIGKGNLLDLFYWEVRMGIWGAKAITEYAAISPVVSPMNSHSILSQFLGLPKKYRTYYHNKLFDTLIREMDGRLSKFPINPSRKTGLIKLMVRLGVYNLYRNILFKLQG